MTPAFGLCDDFVTRWAALDPVAAGMQGLSAEFGAATDYSPDGFAARADLITATLAALGPMSSTSDADRLAAGFLRERLEAQLAWYQLNEPLRLVRAPIGLISSVRDSVDLLPRNGDDAWQNIAARLTAIPVMFASWRASLDAGLGQGLTAARWQAMPWSAPTARARSRPSSRRPPRRPTMGTQRSHVTCVRTTRHGRPTRTASAPSGMPSRYGSTWARTSTSRRPTSGAGPSCSGSTPR